MNIRQTKKCRNVMYYLIIMVTIVGGIYRIAMGEFNFWIGAAWFMLCILSFTFHWIEYTLKTDILMKVNGLQK